MRAGKLDRLIDIQRSSSGTSNSGEPIAGWQTIITRRAASYAPVLGTERFNAPQLAALQQVEFKIRYSADVANLSPLDRVIYPALEPTSPPAFAMVNRLYDILAVNEIGRREGLAIIAARRPDVPT